MVGEWLCREVSAEAFMQEARRHNVDEPLNVAVGKGPSIAEVEAVIQQKTGYKGKFVHHTDKPGRAIWFQTTTSYDGTNLDLVASDAGLTGTLRA